jgi:RNA polymerase sigma factor (sigma-70 family)
MVMKRALAGSRSLVTLFDSGSLGTRSDRDLLECFQADSGAIGQEAFRVLVERHGPMVLGLCRSLVRDQHEAEDAFQATFLVLVRKAASIQRRDTLGPWIYGVAAKVARRARRRLSLRRNREVPVIPDIPGRDLARPDGVSTEQLVHEEIARLPESCRRPLILCCLQGLSYDLAALQLGVNQSTLRGRLERARKRLSARLRERGAGSLVCGTTLESVRAKLAPLPSTLIESTVQFSLRWSRVTGLLGGGAVVPESISALAQGVIQSMVFQTIRVSAVALLAAGAIGTVVVAQQGKERAAQGGGSAAIVAIGPQAEGAGSAQSPANAQGRGRTEVFDPKVQADKTVYQDKSAQIGQRLGTVYQDKNAQIRQRLDTVKLADFPQVAKLETLLKHIKQVTTDANYSGIPIYVDPVGLSDAKLTVASELREIPNQQPIRIVLEYALRPVGLSYQVRDGFLMISSRTAILENRVEEIDRKLDHLIEMLGGLQPAK